MILCYDKSSCPRMECLGVCFPLCAYIAACWASWIVFCISAFICLDQLEQKLYIGGLAAITYLIHHRQDRLMSSCLDGLCDSVTSNVIWLAALGPNPQCLPIVYTMCCAPHQNPLSCCARCSNTSASQVLCLNVPGHHARLLTSRFKIWLGMSMR